MLTKGRGGASESYQPELDSIKEKEQSELRQKKGGLEVLEGGDREAVEKALEQMEDATKEALMTKEFKQMSEESADAAGVLKAIKEQLVELDKDWDDRDDAFRQEAASEDVVTLRARYDEASKNFEALMDRINEANEQYEKSPEVRKIRQHIEVLKKYGIDLREREGVLESEISDLQSKMEEADKAGTQDFEIDQMLSVYAGLMNELDALNKGEWQKRDEFDWIPSGDEGGYFGVKMDIPDWLPNYRAANKGKQLLDRGAVKNRAGKMRETNAFRKGAIERGDDPNAF